MGAWRYTTDCLTRLRHWRWYEVVGRPLRNVVGPCAAVGLPLLAGGAAPLPPPAQGMGGFPAAPYGEWGSPPWAPGGFGPGVFPGVFGPSGFPGGVPFASGSPFPFESPLPGGIPGIVLPSGPFGSGPVGSSVPIIPSGPVAPTVPAPTLPPETPATNVPEPSSLLLMAGGLVLTILLRRNKA